MNIHKIKSFAKINLALNVIGKIKNLHKIESIFSFINLYDLILIKKISSPKHKIFFCGKFSSNIKKVNTVTKLLDILDKKKLLKNNKFYIKIIKNLGELSNLFIIPLEFIIPLVDSKPKFTSEPTNLEILIICFCETFMNFLLCKKFKILAAFIDPPPRPDF